MKSNTTTKIILIFAVLGLALYLLYPTYQYSSLDDEQKKAKELEDQKAFLELKSKSLNLGLDLQGGMHVVLEVDVRELLDKLAKNKDENFISALQETDQKVAVSDEDFITAFNSKLNEKEVKITRYYSSAEHRTEDEVLDFLREQTSEAVDRSKEILTNRVDEFGVTEPIVQKQGDRRIIIELAGVTNPTRVRQLIGRTALLEFKLLKDNIVTAPVAEKINQFISARINPEDTTTTAADEKDRDTTATSAEDLFGIDETDTVATTPEIAEQDSLATLFEEGLFFLDPNNNQTILVPAEKELKFKEILRCRKCRI